MVEGSCTYICFIDDQNIFAFRKLKIVRNPYILAATLVLVCSIGNDKHLVLLSHSQLE